MCRNIHVLHNFDPPATSEEVMAAALQYVRKVAGTTKPSKANEEAFTSSAPPKDREAEAVHGQGQIGRALRHRVTATSSPSSRSSHQSHQSHQSQNCEHRATIW